jgi:hypothetical protein
LLGVMTRNRFLGKKRTGAYQHDRLPDESYIPPFPDPGVPDGLNIPLFASSLPRGVPPPELALSSVFCNGVTSLSLLIGSSFVSSSEASMEKLSGSALSAQIQQQVKQK